MPQIPFNELPDDARLWVFPASRPLLPEEENEVLGRVDAFLADWKAHGAPLTVGRDWREGRFLMVAVDEASVPPSGCSIDALVRVLKEEGAALKVNFMDHGSVWFRRGGGVENVPRTDFKKMAVEGKVGPETPVFDTAITRISQLRLGEWEKPARHSWHGKAFFGF